MAGRKLSDFGELSDAEKKLVAACKVGTECVLGDGKRPEGPSPERNIRADLLRFLILGGDEDCEVHEWGVRLEGAYIGDELDLSFATAKGPTGLFRCQFQLNVLALQAKFEFLNLTGSSCADLMAQSAQVTGDVFLDQGFSAKGEVNLSGAVIGGQLACDGGQFENSKGCALNAQGAKVTGDVFLHKGFSAKGEVRLPGAVIGGQLNCRGGQFENPKGAALNGESLEVVTGGLIWREVKVNSGRVSFHSAQIGTLADDLESWPEPQDRNTRLILDGMTYQRLAGGFHQVKDRLDWLSRGTIWNGDFYPQPYSQLAKVYREMGHRGDARLVLSEQERLIRLYQRKRLWAEKTSLPSTIVVALWWGLLFLWDGLLRLGVGYGYRAIRSVAILWVVGTIAAFLASETWKEGSFAPNSDVILVSAGWSDRMKIDCVPDVVPNCLANPAHDWSSDIGPGLDWDSFNAWGYAADLVIPILDLGQTDAWAPSKDRGPWGKHLWYGRWLLAAAGWLVAGLGAAAITGIIKRE